ncbi:MAG: UvrB/UvrC motif-containing protein [Candidatus Omnitrophica bacterium]|nr:UvrB/UvrC motif-containing protein [Candidatus Omnitrophota bacterium]MCA9416230.1 UvrB/UvrC motif-containing protein [Candidatus Omnitrophota bacterium]MCA9425111.1 UvrB/UvrC motif-containing protein [Candidatus Omnitrophota bacterium]MCA9431873.1 UvrB/UvrC motif-containing protein [Candidatus Omnitrophota bacterium]MCA9437754.1 UvrB/UvrC motif-containing protein [Candidatus Omnitrophota bacterium]
MNGKKCDTCNKPAKIHVTQIQDGQVMDVSLCPECAQKYGFMAPVAEMSVPLNEIIAGVHTGEEAAPISPPSTNESKTCANCGQTFRGFRDSGRLGCPECYDTFQEELEPLLRKVQMGMVHHGKTQIPRKVETNLIPLIHQKREELRQAVAEENFEVAARLRDEVRQLERELNQ